MLQHKAYSLLLLSNLRAAGFVDSGAPRHGVYVGAFERERLVGVVMHAWNGNLLFAAPGVAAELACAAVRSSNRNVAGLLGPAEQVSIARTALGLAARASDLEDEHLLYGIALERLRVPVALEDGTLTVRPSEEDELPLLARWRAEFATELSSSGADLSERVRHQDQMLALRHGERSLFVTVEAGRPVATSDLNARFENIVQVGGVYTPAEFRGKGYARASVAGSLLSVRGDGIREAVLVTGVNNVAARRAYEALGFTVLGAYGLVLFSGAPH